MIFEGKSESDPIKNNDLQCSFRKSLNDDTKIIRFWLIFLRYSVHSEAAKTPLFSQKFTVPLLLRLCFRNGKPFNGIVGQVLSIQKQKNYSHLNQKVRVESMYTMYFGYGWEKRSKVFPIQGFAVWTVFSPYTWPNRSSVTHTSHVYELEQWDHFGNETARLVELPLSNVSGFLPQVCAA